MHASRNATRRQCSTICCATKSPLLDRNELSKRSSCCSPCYALVTIMDDSPFGRLPPELRNIIYVRRIPATSFVARLGKLTADQQDLILPKNEVASLVTVNEQDFQNKEAVAMFKTTLFAPLVTSVCRQMRIESRDKFLAREGIHHLPRA